MDLHFFGLSRKKKWRYRGSSLETRGPRCGSVLVPEFEDSVKASVVNKLGRNVNTTDVQYVFWPPALRWEGADHRVFAPEGWCPALAGSQVRGSQAHAHQYYFTRAEPLGSAGREPLFSWGHSAAPAESARRTRLTERSCWLIGCSDSKKRISVSRVSST